MRVQLQRPQCKRHAPEGEEAPAAVQGERSCSIVPAGPALLALTLVTLITCVCPHSAEEGEPRASCGDQTQQPGQEAAGEQAEEAEAESRAEEAAGRRAALAHGDEVRLLDKVSVLHICLFSHCVRRLHSGMPD